MQNSNFEPTVIQKSYKLYIQIFNLLKNFPKPNRYTLGEKIENTLLNLVELIVLSNIQIKTLREPFLHKASAKCELLKLLLRASFDLRLISERQYIELESKAVEIGKMIGGWIKYCRTR
ncbi:MAG: four helix bundle protein [bacterium]